MSFSTTDGIGVGRHGLGGGAIRGVLVLPYPASASWTSVVHGIASGMRRIYLFSGLCGALAIFWLTRYSYLPSAVSTSGASFPILWRVDRWTGQVSWRSVLSFQWTHSTTVTTTIEPDLTRITIPGVGIVGFPKETPPATIDRLAGAIFDATTNSPSSTP